MFLVLKSYQQSNVNIARPSTVCRLNARRCLDSTVLMWLFFYYCSIKGKRHNTVSWLLPIILIKSCPTLLCYTLSPQTMILGS